MSHVGDVDHLVVWWKDFDGPCPAEAAFFFDDHEVVPGDALAPLAGHGVEFGSVDGEASVGGVVE